MGKGLPSEVIRILTEACRATIDIWRGDVAEATCRKAVHLGPFVDWEFSHGSGDSLMEYRGAMGGIQRSRSRVGRWCIQGW